MIEYDTSHYNKEGRKECIDEMIDKFGLMNVAVFCMINAYKYEYRMGLKEGNSKELDEYKMNWYNEKAKELIKKV